jgi:3-oxoacyl-[acyl-carrier-protein] synthase III
MTNSAPHAPPWTSSARLSVLGTGSALPGEPVSTDALIALIGNRFGIGCEREASAVAQRLGIHSRHVCRDFAQRHEPPRGGDSNPDLAARAVRVALADAGLTIDDIGYLIGHTTTPEQPLPANIAHVADRLGYSGPHVELRQACTGFANALMIATGLLGSPDARPVVIVGSETGSLFFDPLRLAEDRGQIVNMVQMGDGAGAIVLGPAATQGGALEAAWIGSIGLDRKPGIQQHHGALEFAHDFAQILRSGPKLFDADVTTATRLGHSPDKADWIIPHQVSGRVRNQASAHLGLAPERIFVNADRLGNCGSAAIWIALAELRSASLAQGTQVLALGAEASKFIYGGFAYVHG